MYNYNTKRSATLIILIINILSFFLFRSIFYYFIGYFALSSYGVFYKFYFWQLVTYMFLHGDFSHLFFNMFIFFQVGLLLEALWGQKKFLIFYFLSGAITGLISIFIYFLAGLNNIFLIGASGAIYSLMVGFALTMPESIVNIYFIIPIKAKYTPFLFAAIDIFFWIITPSPSGAIGSRVSHLGHLIGIIVGFILYPILINKYISFSEIFNINKKSNIFYNNFSNRKKFKNENIKNEVEIIQNSIYKIKNNIGFSQYEIEELINISQKLNQNEKIICDSNIFEINNIDCLKCPKIALCILRYIKDHNLD
ncbi:MAG: rhomboid family intramembrane serine protease [Spirochaetes bacterium]|nr:rhomboid family intramembrane serine protease [Spirochaetota bacterium]